MLCLNVQCLKCIDTTFFHYIITRVWYYYYYFYPRRSIWKRNGSKTRKLLIIIWEAGFPLRSTISISSRALCALFNILWTVSISLWFITPSSRRLSSKSSRIESDALCINSALTWNSLPLSSSWRRCLLGGSCPVHQGLENRHKILY